MIDFQNGSLFKLAQCNPADVAPLIEPILVDGEQTMVAAKALRDYVVFTNKRLLAVNVQGMTGKKRDITSLPYSKIQSWSVETAGTFDLDAELEIWFSGLGKVRLEFRGRFDVTYLNRLISSFVL
ncbi:MAG: PH domain-containing protein [Actinomycetota bacterium]|nr:PH domain-containing protein [Actinomycetota bacterium]